MGNYQPIDLATITGTNPIVDTLPFSIPPDDQMILTWPGRVPGTVLVIVKMLFNYRICEYTEPYSYGRFWCYQTLEAAITGFAAYIHEGSTFDEPTGWIKATDRPADAERYRVRRARTNADGTTMITIDDPERY